MREERLAWGIAIGAGGPIIVAALLVPVRSLTATTNVALALVVVVVIAAAIGGQVAGIAGAVSATMSYNFFHTRPYLSMAIHSYDDVETTVLLLVVGLIVGAVTSAAMRARATAASATSSIKRVHRVAELVVAGRSSAEVVGAVQHELTGLLGLQTCRFEAPPYASHLPSLKRSGVITGLTSWRLADDGFEPADGLELPVLANGHQIGRFVLMPTPGTGVTVEQRVVAVALADQVAGAIGMRREPSSN